MPKIILEQTDIVKLINKEYPGAEIISDTLVGIEVVIRVTDFQTPSPTKTTTPVVDNGETPTGWFKTHDGKLVQVPEQNRERPLVLDGTSIDAKASGLTLEPKAVTTPGGRMGRERGTLPKY